MNPDESEARKLEAYAALTGSILVASKKFILFFDINQALIGFVWRSKTCDADRGMDPRKSNSRGPI